MEKIVWLLICAFFLEVSQGSASSNATSMAISPNTSTRFASQTTSQEKNRTTLGINTHDGSFTSTVPANASGTTGGVATEAYQPNATLIQTTAHTNASHYIGAMTSGHVGGGMSTTAPVMTSKEVSAITPSQNVKICFMFDVMSPWENALVDRGSELFSDSSKAFVEAIQALFGDDKFDLKYVSFENFTRNAGGNASASLCAEFGSDMAASVYVDEIFAEEAADGDLGGMSIDKETFKTQLRGVTISESFKAKDGECKRVCCGMGGPFIIEKSCSPSNKCRGIRLTKKTSDCLDHCFLDDCESSGNMPTASKAALVLQLVLVVWWMFSP